MGTSFTVLCSLNVVLVPSVARTCFPSFCSAAHAVKELCFFLNVCVSACVGAASWLNGDTELRSIAAVKQHTPPEAQQGFQLAGAGAHQQDRRLLQYRCPDCRCLSGKAFPTHHLEEYFSPLALEPQTMLPYTVKSTT